jgi:hypothetical protein
VPRAAGRTRLRCCAARFTPLAASARQARTRQLAPSTSRRVTFDSARRYPWANRLSRESRMTTLFRSCVLALVCIAFTAGLAAPQNAQRTRIYDLAVELEQRATSMARESFEHFKGWNDTISDQEQAILFKSEAFAASCRLFLRFAEGRSEFFRSEHIRTSLYNAFTFLVNAFSELEREMQRGNVMPYGLSDCRTILNRMEREFSGWSAPDNLAFLDGKYVKAADDTVYLIERQGMGVYSRRAFRSLESLFRFNYDQNRGKDPWKYLVQVPEDTLRRMRPGAPVALTFEGQMIIEAGTRPGRPVYRIEGGRKRPLTRPELVAKFGGWNRVFEVPREVIDGYRDGEPIL